METATLEDTAILDRIAEELDIPVVTGLQAQGDLLIVPADGQVKAATQQIPTVGVPLLRGNGGHTHLLLGAGTCWTPGREGAQTLGTVTVPEGSVAWLAHGDGTAASALSKDAEHGPLAIGPGTYIVRRQREQADELRLVQD